MECEYKMEEKNEIINEALASIKLIEMGFDVTDKEGTKQTEASILQSLVDQGLIEKRD